MKFICPSCKAKYQIADEKVAGRSVRMKCRKCARMIRISEQGAELSDSAQSTAPPPKAVSRIGRSSTAGGGLPPPKAAPQTTIATRPAAPGASVPRASVSGGSAPRASVAGASAPRASTPGAAGAGGSASRASVARRPGLGSAPRASAGLPPPRPTGSSPRTSPAVATAASPSPAVVEAKSPTPQPVKPVEAKAAQASPAQPKTQRLAEAKNPPRQSAREEPQTLVDHSRGLAPAAAEPQASSAPDSALAGAFSAAVSEKATSVDAAAGDEWFVGINGVPVGPIKLVELRSKAAAGAVTNASLVWRDGFEEWKPLGSFPELVAIVEEGTSSARSSVEPFIPPVESGPMPETVPRPMAVAPAVSTTISTAADEAADLELAGIKPRSGLSLAQIFAMVVAIMFGLTVGFVVFSGNEKTKEVVKYVEVPAKAQQSETDSASTPEPESETEQEPEKDEAKAGRKGGKAAKGGSVVAASQTKQEGLKGLSGLKGLKGPQNGPSGNQATESTAGKPLDSAAVQGTVRRYTGSVKRSCWQPALDTRDANAPTSARVSVAITVGATGSVQNVSTSGDPRGYRGLATCIARRVRGWQFPASSGTTTVNVPFVFAAQ